MIHINTVKKLALFALLIFVTWNWAVAENEVRNLKQVGSSMGEGWSQCMVVLKPKVDGVQALADRIMGLGQIDEDRMAESEAGEDL